MNGCYISNIKHDDLVYLLIVDVEFGLLEG
jgi:hypothetical protein